MLDAQLLISFQQQHAMAFVAESVKLMQTGSTADPNQIQACVQPLISNAQLTPVFCLWWSQLQWNCLHVIRDLIGSSSWSGVEVVFSVVSPRRLLACVLSLLSVWSAATPEPTPTLLRHP